VPESVLQDVWQHRRFDARAARLTTGERIEVLHAGRLNRNAGPDFLDARVSITDDDGHTIVLAGDVEIHRSSGEWVVHRHDRDARYDRVVLHVGFAEDRHTGSLRRADGTLLPEVVLGEHVGAPLRRLLFEFFAHARPDFPCAASWDTVPVDVRREWVRRLGRARARERAAALREWDSTDEALYHAAFRALGYAPNADAMLDLSRRVPAALLATLDDPLDREAALLGTAGLLPAPASLRGTDPPAAVYAGLLADRLAALAPALTVPMAASVWSAGRLRPTNQPALRVAQAAALAAPGGLASTGVVEHLLALASVEEPVRALRAWLLSFEPSPFWMDHVRFQTRIPPRNGHIGVDRADRLIVDAILPALVLEARRRGEPERERRLVEVADRLPAGSDSVVRRYAPFRPAGELEASGLRALARDWCARGRCLQCGVGRFLLGESQ